jgi:hypothetical protein
MNASALAAMKYQQQQSDYNEYYQQQPSQDDQKMPAVSSITTSEQAMQNIVDHSSKTGGHHHHKHSAHIIVKHDYHDHSHDNQTEYSDEHPARGGVSTPFPLKLHEMLESVKSEGFEHIVSWQPHGRCFVVHKPKEFVALLPRYFKLSKLASFQRQLNLYGFQRLTRGRDRGGYYHELFLRGKQFLAHNIQRLKVKGTGVRARSNPDQEPDFWAMEWMEEEDGGTRTPPHDYRPMESSSKTTKRSTGPSTTSFVYPGMISSTTVPIVSPPTKKVKVAAAPAAAVPSSTQAEDDVVCAFGNKTFHYLDPFQPLSLSDMSRRAAAAAAASSYNPSSMYQQQQTNLLIDEAETFFQDFNFPDHIGSEIENDAIFGDMLETLIA